MDSYEYREFRQILREQMREELKLTYEKRLNEYRLFLEQFKNLEIRYGTEEYNCLLDEMKNRRLCSESDSLRIGLLVNEIKFKYHRGKIIIH
ncbi:hypothetical protein [Clostridium beijerinckii]|uniref:Uncharacterized protein n=1 Tax=Clostridium beijerinckii TaxID=1520 RepID=A0AAW3WGB6_CLOBE|nr:hypothetical protein [Clostridium beijerinckii]MBC2460392.1 hypothetical protein [Clostridium beijerinckii]MBC2477882.1 hypothetical protein [Clostridium beijerinckii]NOV63566.1 hypothetical protein [Clostridium beijerinckii]NOV73423.1 hypothetical protein [Clostridium beijerinckii]NOW35450.1 hypothetical protein [Clostridium beijerinckii]